MGQARTALSSHWPEYLIEAAGLGLFMLMAGICVMLVNAPDAIRIIGNPDIRRALVGVAMGLTAIAIIYSPWGRQSGAHLNPAVTLTFLRLGKIAPWDAAFYVIAQFVGGVAGVALVAAPAGQLLAHPAVNYVATLPGPGGSGV